MLLLRIAVVSLLIAGGQVLLSLALSGHEPDGGRTLGLIRAVVGEWWFWVACVSTGLGAIVWLRVVQEGSLSSAYPLMVGMSFGFVTLAGVALRGERLPLAAWGGLALIVAGIWLVSSEMS